MKEWKKGGGIGMRSGVRFCSNLLRKKDVKTCQSKGVLLWTDPSFPQERINDSRGNNNNNKKRKEKKNHLYLIAPFVLKYLIKHTEEQDRRKRG